MASVADIVRLFNSASSFELAALVLQNAPEPQKWGVLPSKIACHAFAIEAYYKIVITLEGGSYRDSEHDLLNLHEECHADTQKRLEREWWADNGAYFTALRDEAKKRKITLPRNLRSGLSFAAKSFIDFRYQDSRRPMSYWLQNLGTLLRRIIIEKMPDLAPNPPSPFVLLGPEARNGPNG